MFHMQRWCIRVHAFCLSCKWNSFHVPINKKIDDRVEPPPPSVPSLLRRYNKTPQSFTDFNRLGKMHKKQQCALTWVLEGGKFVFRGRVGRGSTKAPTTDRQRRSLAAGSVCYETAFCPFPSAVFLSTSPVWMYKSSDRVTKQFFFSLFSKKKRTAINFHSGKAKIGPEMFQRSSMSCQE